MFVTIEITKMHGWTAPLQVISFVSSSPPPPSNKLPVLSAQEMGLQSFLAALWHENLLLFVYIQN